MEQLKQDNLEEPRYLTVSRRAFLKKGASLGAFVFVAACSSDAAALVSTTVGQPPSTSATSTDDTTSTEAPTTTEATTTTHAGSGLPSGGEMVVDFTYEADGAGRILNPYIAVWVEDSTGDLVDTIALWFLQSTKGERWLSDLIRWSSVDGSSTTVDTISSATRTPGDYSLVWDGTDTTGVSVPDGDYFICIEAAREHGPYSLIREAISLAGESFDVQLADQGELKNASVQVVV